MKTVGKGVRKAIMDIDEVVRVILEALDEAGYPRFEITGPASDGRLLSLICSLKNTGAVLFITVYEGL